MTQDRKDAVHLSNPTVAANLIGVLRMVSRDHDISLSGVAIEARQGELIVWPSADKGIVDEAGELSHDFLFGLYCAYDGEEVPLSNFNIDNGPDNTRVSRLGLPAGYEVIPTGLVSFLKARLGNVWEEALSDWRATDSHRAER